MLYEKTFAQETTILLDTEQGTLTMRGKHGRLGPGVGTLRIEGGVEVNFLQDARIDVQPDALIASFEVGMLAGSLTFSDHDGDWLAMDIAVRNAGPEDVRLAFLDFLRCRSDEGFDFGGKPEDMRLLCNARGMGFYVGTRALLPEAQADLYDLGSIRRDGMQAYERWNYSWMVLAGWDRHNRRGFVIGAQQPMHESLQFGTEEWAFFARVFADSRLLLPGMTARAPRVLFNLHDAPREGLEAYAACNRQPLRTHLADYTGWNSFDYYLNTETLPDILENAAEITAQPGWRAAVKWICVDSGWEYRWGEYVAVEHRFPGGIAALVRALRAQGFATGLWTAPYLVDLWSTHISRWNADMLVRDAEGKRLLVFCDNCYVVDPTHPAGEQYLRELYQGLYADGVRYFKCDFLELGFNGQRRYNQAMSLTDVNRRGLEIIREAIGPDSFLLACISTPEAAIGICDAIRVSGDMHNFWSSAQLSAPNTAWRWWMHGNFYWNDPDMIAIRGTETADISGDAYAEHTPFTPMTGNSGTPFTAQEARVWMTFCLLSGGLFTLGDRIKLLNDAGKALIETALSHRSAIAAKPIDFYDAGLPALYLQRDGQVVRLGVFNWYDERKTIRVHTDGLLEIPHGALLRDIWSGHTYTWQGEFDVELAGRDCLYLILTSV